MNKISLQMYTLRDFTKTPEDLRETIFKLRDIGFSMIQYSIPKTFDTKQVKAIFDEAKMKNDSVFCALNDLDDRANEIICQCDMFETQRIRVGSIPRELSVSASGYREYTNILNKAGQAYKKEGKKFLYHFHAFEFIRFGDTTGIDILLDESDPEVLEIIPDTHWIQTGGKDPETFLRQHKDRFVYMHAKDYELGPREDMLEAHAARYAPVGEGNLDWNGILSACKDAGVMSYGIEQDEFYGRDPFDAVKSSFDFLASMGVNE